MGVHILDGGDHLVQDVQDVLLLHADGLLAQELLEVAAVRVLHLDHEDAVALEAVVIPDDVRVVHLGQDLDLVQGHLAVVGIEVEHVDLLDDAHEAVVLPPVQDGVAEGPLSYDPDFLIAAIRDERLILLSNRHE